MGWGGVVGCGGGGGRGVRFNVAHEKNISSCFKCA